MELKLPGNGTTACTFARGRTEVGASCPASREVRAGEVLPSFLLLGGGPVLTPMDD